jgi:hypothetical protein
MCRSEDMFIGALWRSKGVTLLSEPRAQAVHDEQHHKREVGYVEFRTYANLFDAFLANRNLPRALAIECPVLALGANLYFSRPESAWTYLAAWYCGHEYWYAIGVSGELWHANHCKKERREGEKTIALERILGGTLSR